MNEAREVARILGGGFLGILLGLFFIGLYAGFLTWPVMLAIGAAASHSVVPALGFWAVFWLIVAYKAARMSIISAFTEAAAMENTRGKV